eukprot:s11295_g1.t1
MRVDIEDFFMSGTVDELVNTTIPLIPRCRRNTNRKALTFLLNHQYVVSVLITERTYKVVKGTGMGVRHSGAVADSSFFTLVEHDFVTEKMQDRLELSYGISHYFRFKDDIFFVAAQRTSGIFPTVAAESASFQTEARKVFMRDGSIQQCTWRTILYKSCGISRKHH